MSDDILTSGQKNALHWAVRQVSTFLVKKTHPSCNDILHFLFIPHRIAIKYNVYLWKFDSFNFFKISPSTKTLLPATQSAMHLKVIKTLKLLEWFYTKCAVQYNPTWMQHTASEPEKWPERPNKIYIILETLALHKNCNMPNEYKKILQVNYQ